MNQDLCIKNFISVVCKFRGCFNDFMNNIIFYNFINDNKVCYLYLGKDREVIVNYKLFNQIINIKLKIRNIENFIINVFFSFKLVIYKIYIKYLYVCNYIFLYFVQIFCIGIKINKIKLISYVNIL